jgi:hypothetical protein
MHGFVRVKGQSQIKRKNVTLCGKKNSGLHFLAGMVPEKVNFPGSGEV